MRTKWTNELLIKTLKKFKSHAEVHKSKIGCSARTAAVTRGIYDEISKNYIRIKRNTPWTNKELFEEAAKFKSTKELKASKHGRNIKNRLVKHGIYRQATKHLIKTRRDVWKFQEILIEAKKYKSRSEWLKKSVGSYNAAHKYFPDKLPVLTSHMERLGNLYQKCIYSIRVKNKKLIYIGLTYNFKKRILKHLNSKKFKDIKKLYGDSSIETKQLTKYIDREKAGELEDRIMQRYQNNGYILLNQVGGGAIGGKHVKWNDEAIFKSAKKFKHLAQWQKNEPGAYYRAKFLNIFKEVTKHMEILNPKGKWSTKEVVLKDARKYKHRAKWTRSSGAAVSAKLHGWFEEAVAHMTKPDITRIWTKEEILKEAKKYNHVSDWVKNSPGSYTSSFKKKNFEIAKKHMKRKYYGPLKWSRKLVLEDAKKYKTRTEWKYGRGGAFHAAKRYGWLEEATAHMKLRWQ